MPGYVASLVKTPTSQALLGLVKYPTGSLAYNLLPHGLGVGMFLRAFIFTEYQIIPRKVGTYTTIAMFRQGDSIININSHSKRIYCWAKAAGTKCIIQYLSFSKDFYVITIPSGKKQKLPINTMVTLGQNANILHKKEVFGNAGRVRFSGTRPTVRGVAMNPVDHPHGGRTKTSQPEVSPWGWVAKKNY